MTDNEPKKRGRPRKWTEETAEKLAYEVEEWFMEPGKERERLFFRTFFNERKLDRDLLQDLRLISPVFSRIIKRLEALQEQRIATLAMQNKLNNAMAIFVLKNKHGWADKQEVKQESRVVNVGLDLKTMDEEALKERMRELTDNPK